AIKCLKLQSTLGSSLVESFVRRFRDEGRILYRLSQGNLHIVRSVASGTTIAGTTGSLVPYTVLEWLEGHSLAQDFERRRAAAMRGRPLMEAAALFSTAFEAVAYAHQAGVVHRDLNPGNIFLTQTREGVKAKVLDFGVAKIVSDHALELGPRAHTLGQIKIFSPAYAAPEQFDDKLGKIGPYTDVYTLAIVFIEALRDEPALTGENIGALIGETLDENRRPTPRTLGLDVPDAIEKVFARATSLKPQDRQQSAGEFWSELAGVLNIRNIVLPSASVKSPSRDDAALRKPQFGTQTVRMESPMQNAKPAPSAPDVRGGASGLASTVAASDMDGRFSATMLAPENLGTAPTLAAPIVMQALQQPQTQPMQPALGMQ
ncbi:MAG: serine/threonine protein kinase, partial [Polyangiaceae bacterium]